ncbi:glycine receptor subunit alpha-2-like [Uloborus diversus]|uniref:glycine receptor subunit alpha-2-like n=1 Tax=Uloborus diversus TaxID=327109 RepID=UPI00240A3993|nr:glycine receptor subunit alpha-2-like [Uloborus diversus]
MEYIIDTRLTFTWNDLRLMTPECRDENEDCDDHFDLKRKIGEMWTPDLYILNSKTAKHHDQPLRNGMVYLVADGQVFLSKRITMTLRCPMDLVLYPLDTQGCPLLICPYSLPESELELKWVKQGVGILDDTQDGQNKFKLSLPVLTGEMKLRYEGPDVSGYFSCVNATFRLVRQNGYHMGYSYTVTSLIVMVSWISFWLPVTAVPARVTLGITTLLTLLTTANYVRSALPPIPYVTAIDVWVGLCILFVFLALLVLPISHFLSQKNKERPKSTQKNKVQLFYSNSKCSECGGRKTNSSDSENSKPSFDVDSLCRKIFPVSFLILNIAYWSYYVSRSQKMFECLRYKLFANPAVKDLYEGASFRNELKRHQTKQIHFKKQ